MNINPYITWEAECFFDGKPLERALYLQLAEWLHVLVPGARMQVHKTQISYYYRTGFCFVWLPDSRVKNRPPHSLAVSFGLFRPLHSERVFASAHPTVKRWTHHTVLENAQQLNQELATWILEAAQLAGKEA